MSRTIKFLLTEMKRMTLYTVVGDLESKSFKHADPYNSPPPPCQKKSYMLNGSRLRERSAASGVLC